MRFMKHHLSVRLQCDRIIPGKCLPFATKLRSPRPGSPSFTHRLSLVPLRVKLLFRLQAEESVPGHIVHLVVHDPVGLGIQTLQQWQITMLSTPAAGTLQDVMVS